MEGGSGQTGWKGREVEREQEMKEGDLMSVAMSSHRHIAQWVASDRLDCTECRGLNHAQGSYWKECVPLLMQFIWTCLVLSTCGDSYQRPRSMEGMDTVCSGDQKHHSSEVSRMWGYPISMKERRGLSSPRICFTLRVTGAKCRDFKNVNIAWYAGFWFFGFERNEVVNTIRNILFSNAKPS